MLGQMFTAEICSLSALSLKKPLLQRRTSLCFLVPGEARKAGAKAVPSTQLPLALLLAGGSAHVPCFAAGGVLQSICSSALFPAVGTVSQHPFGSAVRAAEISLLFCCKPMPLPARQQ